MKPINQKITGDIFVPGDKSISHRAIILSSIADKITVIENILLSEDVLATINIMRALGVEIILDGHKKTARVLGVGLHGLKSPEKPLDCGNSGTTMRLLCGLLCAQQFNAVLMGDESLSKRPMLRVAEPLRLMGAKIYLADVASNSVISVFREKFVRQDAEPKPTGMYSRRLFEKYTDHGIKRADEANGTAPITIIGNQKLMSINYESKIPSAQVKSAILLASLYSQGDTAIKEKVETRDHTEKMLKLFHSHPHPHSHLTIPGDISSAAFFIVAACITPDSDLIIRQVGINPFRTGIITILKLMGANIEIFNKTFFGLEPVADIRIQYTKLKGIVIPEEFISKAIDEFPAIFIAAVTAKGNTLLCNAKELRVKESDRISVMCAGLKNLGVKTEEYNDGILIYGDQIFQGGRVDAKSDHRVAMAFAIAGNIARDSVIIDNGELIKTSFPNFSELANQIGMKICL